MENPPFRWYLPGKMGFSWAMFVSGRVIAVGNRITSGTRLTSPQWVWNMYINQSDFQPFKRQLGLFDVKNVQIFRENSVWNSVQHILSCLFRSVSSKNHGSGVYAMFEDKQVHLPHLPWTVLCQFWGTRTPNELPSQMYLPPRDKSFIIFQEISNRTHWTDPEKTWVSNSSTATYLGVVPFNFWWKYSLLMENIAQVLKPFWRGHVREDWLARKSEVVLKNHCNL